MRDSTGHQEDRVTRQRRAAGGEQRTATARRTAAPAGERGLAMISVVLVVTLMLALGIIGTQGARVGLRMAGADVRGKKALATAEAGLNHVFALIKTDLAPNGYPDGFDDELAGSGTGGAVAAVGGLSSVEGDSYRFRRFGARSTDGYHVRVVDNVDETTGWNDPAFDSDLRVKVESRGMVGGAERIIEAVIAQKPLYPPFGLFGDDWTELAGGATTDSYDSEVGLYPNGPGNDGDIGSNGDVNLAGAGTAIDGDAQAGGSVDPGSSSISGDEIDGADPIPLEPVSPCGPPYSDGTGITGGYYDPATGNLATGCNLVGANPHATTVLCDDAGFGPPSSITLDAGTYCISDIAVLAGQTISIAGNVVINSTGKIRIAGNGIVNPGEPTQLQIFSSRSDPDIAAPVSDTSPDVGIVIEGGASAKFALYAPDANIHLAGGLDFYGLVVGKTIGMTGGGQFHYDEALRRVPGPDLKIVTWRDRRDIFF